MTNMKAAVIYNAGGRKGQAEATEFVGEVFAPALQ